MADDHAPKTRPPPDAAERLARTITYLTTAGAVAFVALVVIFVLTGSP